MSETLVSQSLHLHPPKIVDVGSSGMSCAQVCCSSGAELQQNTRHFTDHPLLPRWSKASHDVYWSKEHLLTGLSCHLCPLSYAFCDLCQPHDVCLLLHFISGFPREAGSAGYTSCLGREPLRVFYGCDALPLTTPTVSKHWISASTAVIPDWGTQTVIGNSWKESQLNWNWN